MIWFFSVNIFVIGLVVFMINKVNICNWWNNKFKIPVRHYDKHYIWGVKNWWYNKLKLSGRYYYKSYIRVIKKQPELMEFIYEIGEDDRLVPINDNIELVFKNQKGLRKLHDIAQKWSHGYDNTVRENNLKEHLFTTIIKKNRNGEFYLMLKETGSNNHICLNLNSIYDLNDQIRLIYTNIKVYRVVSGRRLKMLVAEEILLAAGYFFYMKYFAYPNNIYWVGFLSVMTSILFCSLIFNFIDGD